MTDPRPHCTNEGSGTVKLYDEIDINCLEDLQGCLTVIFEAKQDVVIDFEEVIQMDTAAIQLLMAFKRSFSSEHRVEIKSVSPALSQTWQIIGAHEMLLK